MQTESVKLSDEQILENKTNCLELYNAMVAKKLRDEGDLDTTQLQLISWNIKDKIFPSIGHRIVINLSNNKRVANFSSPHIFEFEDGMVLPAVSKEIAEKLSVTFIETEINDKGDVELSFILNATVWDEIQYWEHEHAQGNVDIVFIPLPMLSALRNFWVHQHSIESSPFRAIRMIDRCSKLVSISKQCV